jgi:polyphosphate kinase
MCAVKPGVPGLSENIRVRSILGRYLEHSRVFVFANGGDPDVFIGSADMMHRNLDRRVEALVKLVQPDHIEDLLDLFTSAMGETVASWHLNQDGSWTRHQFDKTGGKLIDLQDQLMNFVAGRKVSTR